MIRSIRSLSSKCSVWVPGLKGPAEAFDSRRCLPNDPEFWDSVANHYRRAMVFDCGKRQYLPQEAEIEEGVQAAIVRLVTTTPAEWGRMKIGYGDRFRAVSAVRAYMRRSDWRTGMGRRQGTRKYRPYPQSGKASIPGPDAVAMAMEEATRGIEGKPQGSRHKRTETMAAEDARVAMIGYTREEKLGTIHVSGGVASVATDGTMQHVETRRWVENDVLDDGTVVQTEWSETTPKMVPGYTKVQYDPGFVFDSAEW